MKHKVLFDGNGSSLIRVVGVGHYVPVAEAEALKAERDALAAQAQALKTAAKFILDAKKPETKRKAYAALADAVDKTPQQHLAERDAQKGRAGFVAGFKASHRLAHGNKPDALTLGLFANQYADSIRKGEVE